MSLLMYLQQISSESSSDWQREEVNFAHSAFFYRHRLKCTCCAVVALFNAIGKSRAEKEAENRNNGKASADDDDDSVGNSKKRKQKKTEKVDRKTEIAQKKQNVKNLSKDLFLNSVRADKASKQQQQQQSNSESTTTGTASTNRTMELKRPGAGGAGGAGDGKGIAAAQKSAQKWAALSDNFMMDKGNKLRVRPLNHTCLNVLYIQFICDGCRIGTRTIQTMARTCEQRGIQFDMDVFVFVCSLLWSKDANKDIEDKINSAFFIASSHDPLRVNNTPAYKTKTNRNQ